MITVSQPDQLNKAELQASDPESIVQHLRRIAAVAAWAVAPLVALALVTGRAKLGLSVAAGGFVSFVVFAGLHVMVFRGLGIMAPRPGTKPEPPGPAAMAQFALGSLLKFVLAIGIVYGLVLLKASLLALLVGFAVAQVAIAISVSRSLKGPVS